VLLAGTVIAIDGAVVSTVNVRVASLLTDDPAFWARTLKTWVPSRSPV
jgi:hypothetical protein